MKIQVTRAEWSTLFPELDYGVEVSAPRVDKALADAESRKTLSVQRVAELRLRRLFVSEDRGDIVRVATPHFRKPFHATEDEGPSNLLLFRVSNTNPTGAPNDVDSSPREPAVVLDTGALPEIRGPFLAWLEKYPTKHPNLRPDRFEMQSGPTRAFNCFSNSIRVYTRCEEPGTRVADLDALYRQHGFTPLDGLDFSLRAGFEKVVLYAHRPGDELYEKLNQLLTDYESPDNDGPVCVHAIVQEPDGGWSSKQGWLARIKCSSPHDLAGGDYGQPVKVYVRPIPGYSAQA